MCAFLGLGFFKTRHKSQPKKVGHDDVVYDGSIQEEVVAMLERNLGWPAELNRAWFAGASLPSLIERLRRYETMAHPQTNLAGRLGLPTIYPEYEASGNRIARIGIPAEDVKICSVATFLRGRVHSNDQRTCDYVFETVQHYLGTPLAKFLLSVPYVHGLVTARRVSAPQQAQATMDTHHQVAMYKALENILFEIYEELGEGQVMSDAVITDKLLAIAYGLPHARLVLESLQHCYEGELRKIRENSQFRSSMKAVFEITEEPERIADVMSIVVEKMNEAQQDGQAHSRQLQMADPPIVVSISVWPQCTLSELADRFHQVIGAPYMEAAQVYINKYAALGALAYIHLFFCYTDSESGVATAFVPCQEHFGEQTGMILPESIIRQTDDLIAGMR